MRRKLSVIFFFFSFLVLSLCVFPQTPSQPIEADPLSGQLISFSEIPVDYSTGVPDISIPVHTINASEWQIPIRLLYHPSALKLASDAGDVGLGWTLQAAGTISRSMYGLPDEKPGAGYIYTHGLVPAGLQAFDGQYWSYTLKRLAADGLIDFEPDIFHVKAPGLSCRIIFDVDEHSGLLKAFTIPHSDILIDEFYNEQGIAGWKILDENGVTYYFGSGKNTQEAIDMSLLSSGNGNPSSYPSAWHLVKMIAPGLSDSVMFSYDSVNVNLTRTMSETKVFPLGSCSGWDSQEQYTLTLLSHRINAISHNSGKIRFVRHTPRLDVAVTDYRLDSIVVEDWKGLPIRRYALATHYLSSSGCQHPSTHDCLRLILDSIQIIGSGSLKLPAWKMNYYSGSLPAKSSKATDHWGFYNGAISNTSSIPGIQSGPVSFSGADREVHESYLNHQAIRSVVNPFGGIIEFTWESHEYTGVPALSEYSPVLSPASVFLSGSNTSQGPFLDTVTASFSLSHGQQVDMLHSWSDLQALSIESFARIVDYMGNPSKIINPSDPQQPFYLSAGDYSLEILCAQNETGQVNLSWQNCEIDSGQVNSMADMAAGGLRIKRIRYFDGREWLGEKNYQYVLENGCSSGALLSGTPLYIHVFKKPVITWTGGNGNGFPIITAWCGYLKISSSDMATGSSLQGHVAYSRVVESFGQNGGFGSLTYRYSSNSISRNAFFPYPPGEDGFYGRGKLISVTEKAADGSVKSQTENFYSSVHTVFEPGQHEIRGVRIAWEEKSIGPAFDRFSIAPYTYTTGRLRLDSTINKEFKGNSILPLTQKTVYQYTRESYDEPSQIIHHFADGSTEINCFIRNRDLLSPVAATPSVGMTRFRQGVEGLIRSFGASFLSDSLPWINAQYIDTARTLIELEASMMRCCLDSLREARDVYESARINALPQYPTDSEGVAACMMAASNRNSKIWGKLILNQTENRLVLSEGTYTSFKPFHNSMIRPSVNYEIADTSLQLPLNNTILTLDNNGMLNCSLKARKLMENISYTRDGKPYCSFQPGEMWTVYRYRKPLLQTIFSATGMDTLIASTDFAGPSSRWQYSAIPYEDPKSASGRLIHLSNTSLTHMMIPQGRYRVLMRAKPGIGSILLASGNVFFPIDTIGLISDGWYWLSSVISLSTQGNVSLSGDIIVDEIYMMTAETNYQMAEYSPEASLLISFGAGIPFIRNEFDELGRYTGSLDHAGRLRFARKYSLTGNPIY